MSLILEALGCYLGKTQAYETVQQAVQRVPGLKQEQILEGDRAPVLGTDVTG